MTKPEALFYFKNLTYNFATWGQDEPVNLTYEGQRYHGYLKNHEAPYQVELVEVFENGGFRRIPKRRVEIPSLEGVRFLHHHGH